MTALFAVRKKITGAKPVAIYLMGSLTTHTLPLTTVGMIRYRLLGWHC